MTKAKPTMKSIAEERRSGTLETLLSAPVNTTVVVLAKVSASYTIYLLQWAFTLGFVFILHHFARDPRLLDPGPLVGGYVFIAVTGLLYVAIGTLASALVRSQAAAGIIGFAVILVAIFGARMNTAWNGCCMPSTTMSVSKLSIWRPYPLRRTEMSMTPKLR